MKKYISIVIALMAAALAVMGCGSSGSSSASALTIDSFKTLGDVLEKAPDGWEAAEYDDKFEYGFKLEDKFYVVTAVKSEEVAEAINAIDFMDPDYDNKYAEVISSLEITKVKDITDEMLTREELDALVGKTGKELFDNGWYNSGYNSETMEFWMGYGPFTYLIIFDGEIPESELETFVAEEGTLEMTVKSADFYSLGDITYAEEE